MDKYDRLQEIHLDILREMGNIGIGNAATSLAQMVGRKIDMEVPQALVADLKHLIQLIGSEEDLVTCISLVVEGDISSNVFFILREKSALEMVDLLMGAQAGTHKKIDENSQSALQEVGNILTGSILNAISSMTGLNMKPSVPAFAYDMLGAVLSSALLERGYFDDRVLIIETRFFDENVVIDGYFFMVPDALSLEKIFKSLGINF